MLIERRIRYPEWHLFDMRSARKTFIGRESSCNGCIAQVELFVHSQSSDILASIPILAVTPTTDAGGIVRSIPTIFPQLGSALLLDICLKGILTVIILHKILQALNDPLCHIGVLRFTECLNVLRAWGDDEAIAGPTTRDTSAPSSQVSLR